MTYNDKLSDVKTKLSAVQTAVNALPTNEDRPVNTDAVTKATEAFEASVEKLTA